MPMALSTPILDQTECRGRILTAARYLSRVHGIALLYGDLDHGYVGFYYPSHRAIVVRLGAQLEDQVHLFESVLTRLGVPSLLDVASEATMLRLVPELPTVED